MRVEVGELKAIESLFDAPAFLETSPCLSGDILQTKFTCP